MTFLVRLRLASPMAALFGGAALAVMPPAVYENARAGAAYHVQMEVSKITLPEKAPGPCSVKGRIIKIFRDTPGDLTAGADIGFQIDCKNPDDNVPIGGALWTDSVALGAAKYIEVYLNGYPPAFGVALWQSRIIDAPSGEPQLPVEQQ